MSHTRLSRNPSPLICPALLMLALLSPLPVAAQWSTSSDEGITATGSVTVSLPPTLLQMSIQIEGSGSELKQAAEELETRVKLANERLLQSGAIAESITIGSPKLKSAAGASEQQRMEQMMMQYGGGRRGKEMLQKTQSVTATQEIVARWPLPEAEGVQRLLQVQTLIQSIETADIGSSQRDQPMSAAQKELAIEIDAMQDQFSYDEQPAAKPGTPTFTYIAIVEKAAHRQAIEDAFESAKESIELIAEATGQTTGPVRPMTTQMQSGERDAYNPYGSPSPTAKRDPVTGNTEISGSDASQIDVTVDVTAIAAFDAE